MCLKVPHFSKITIFLGTVERQAGHFFRLTVTEADLKVSNSSLPLNNNQKELDIPFNPTLLFSKPFV
jgi:hypothetical protein